MAIDGPAGLTGAHIARSFREAGDRGGDIGKVGLGRDLDRIGHGRDCIERTGVGEEQGRHEIVAGVAQLGGRGWASRGGWCGGNGGRRLALVGRILSVDGRDPVFVTLVVFDVEVGKGRFLLAGGQQGEVVAARAAVDIKSIQI